MSRFTRQLRDAERRARAQAPYAFRGPLGGGLFGKGGPPAYDWTKDSQILGRWKAGSFADLAAVPVWGALVQQGGVVTTTANALDGNSAWSFTRGAAVRLRTPTNTPQPGPFTFFIVGRSNNAANAYPDEWLGDASNAGTRLFAFDSTHSFLFSGGSGIEIALGGMNFCFQNLYVHGYQTRYSVEGVAYTGPVPDGPSDLLNGIVIGGDSAGANGAGIDICEIIVVEGQSSAALIAGITNYVRAQYPSLGVAALPPAPFTVTQNVLSVVAPGTDFIVCGGQSNNGCNTTAATTAPSGSTFLFGSPDQFTAMRLQYDNLAVGTVDTVQSRGAGAGGNATSMANAYATGTGRNVLILPISSGGSAMSIAGTGGGNPQNTWQRDAINGRNNHLRDTLYWSGVARIKNLVALGLTFRYMLWYQGEDEAINGPQATHAALTLAFFTSFFADCGLPQRVIVQPIANTVNGATAPHIAQIQAGQASLALAGTRLVGTAWAGAMEADNLHVPAAGQNVIGAAAAALALAQPAATGWY